MNNKYINCYAQVIHSGAPKCDNILFIKPRNYTYSEISNKLFASKGSIKNVFLVNLI